MKNSHNIKESDEKELRSITKINKKNTTFNLTHSSQTTFYYPKNYKELQKIIWYLGKIKKKVLIKSGNCGYGDKSNLQDSEFAISLSKLNRILKFNIKKKNIIAQAGIGLYELFLYLKKKGFIIYNIPGGKNITLGGGVSGNVHGRPSKKNFENFGDNIISLKVMLENGEIKSVTKKNKIFYKIIGGLGICAIILEVKLKIHKIESYFVEKVAKNIGSIAEFKKYEKNVINYYGYINYFNINKFEGNFIHFIPKKNFDNKKIVELKKYSILNLLNFLRIPIFISFLVNSLTLKVLYNLIFRVNKKFKIFIKNEIFTLDRSMYFDLIQIIPNFFRNGMIEIQFSVQNKKLFNLILILKRNFLKFKIYPSYFLLKKMHSTNKKYSFNFPKYSSCISLGFSKKNYNENKIYFNNLYNLLLKNNCNFYITKDETLIENVNSLKLKKYFNLSHFKKNKILSSDFKEKVIRSIK